MRRSSLTKDDLLRLNISVIDNDIYYKGRKLHSYIITKEHKYSEDKQYRVVSIYDSETRLQKTYMYSNVLYAWYNYVCPEGYEVDHINNDSLDDRIDNYQLLLKKDNLSKKPRQCNQYSCSWTDDQYQKYQSLKKRITRLEKWVKVYNTYDSPFYQERIKIVKSKLTELRKELKNFSKNEC